ncbi:MAG TPA: cyclodeaminase/cyclohydrolase family protein, partial [Acidobacteriota bacterium]|nr:cyclodeaminase/cyclohydrolase family protein [Acidobacteriota bacterium]
QNQILENRLEGALTREPAMSDFVEKVAAPDAVPGGGSVAALAGSLGAALGEMVAGLTEGRKKYEAVDGQVRESHAKLALARGHLRELIQADSAAYQEVVDAMKLPKGTDAEKAARADAVELATRHATEIPLTTARAAAEVLDHLQILASIGNPNARSDTATGAQLAFAALKGAQYNVLINAGSLKDKSFAGDCLNEAAELERKGWTVLQSIDSLITAP